MHISAQLNASSTYGPLQVSAQILTKIGSMKIVFVLYISLLLASAILFLIQKFVLDKIRNQNLKEVIHFRKRTSIYHRKIEKYHLMLS